MNELRSLEESVANHLEAEEIKTVIKERLDIRLRRILELRSEGKTLDEVGTKLGVSGERVRQLESLAKFVTLNFLSRR